MQMMNTLEGMPSKPQRLKLAVAVMAYGGQVCSQQINMWIDFGAHAAFAAAEIETLPISIWDVNPVDRARNFALAHAMRQGAAWLLMVDADTFVMGAMPGLDLLRMIIDGAREEAAIVVAQVQSRAPGVDTIMVYRRDRTRSTRYPDGRLRGVYFGRDDKPLGRIDAASAAIMAINLKHVGDAAFRFVEETETRAGYSEDIEFCNQIRAAGGTILCDTRIVTGHLTRPMVLVSGR
jgi:hypothetical protein